MSTDPYDTLAALPNIKMVFEIGCDYMHWTTPTIRRIYPDATIHCFDPVPENLMRVRANDAEKLLTATFHNFAIADTTGLKHLWLASNDGASSSLKRPVVTGIHPEHVVNFESEAITVRCITLDEFCYLRDIKSIDLIHMDVQSGEDLVIKGATEMLKHTRYIFTEHNTGQCYNDEPAFSGISALLPGWIAIHCWPYDALFRNDNLCQ